MKKALFCLICLSIPLLYSCKEKIVRYSDSGKTINIVVGQILKLELPGDAMSSSNWRKLTYNDSVLIRKGKPNYMLGNNSSTPGVYYYRFSAINPGTSKVIMEYGDKFDDDEPATRTFEIEVVVIEKSN